MKNGKPDKGYTKVEVVLCGLLVFAIFLTVRAMLPDDAPATTDAAPDPVAEEELHLLSVPEWMELSSDDDPDVAPSIKGKKNMPTPGKAKKAAKKPSTKPATAKKPLAKKGMSAKPAAKPLAKSGGKPTAKKAPAKRPHRARSARKTGSDTKLIRVPEELRLILDQLEQSEWSREIEVKMLAAIKRWGVKDPGQALNFSLELERRGTRNGALGRILPMWVKESPQAALEWFTTTAQTDPFLVQDMTRSVYSWVAAKDIKSATAAVWDLPTTAMRRAALQSVSQRLIILGKEQRVLQMYESATSTADKKMAIDVVMEKMARYEPEALGQWVSALPDPKMSEHGINRLVANWSRDHPSAAAEWVMSTMPAGKQRGQQIAAVTRSWVREDVVAAAEWLVTLPLQSGEPDAAVDAFARAVLPQNADYASAWSFSVTDKGRRWRLMEHIGRTMIKESPDAAREYINLTDLPAASKAKLLGN